MILAHFWLSNSIHIFYKLNQEVQYHNIRLHNVININYLLRIFLEYNLNISYYWGLSKSNIQNDISCMFSLMSLHNSQHRNQEDIIHLSKTIQILVHIQYIDCCLVRYNLNMFFYRLRIPKSINYYRSGLHNQQYIFFPLNRSLSNIQYNEHLSSHRNFCMNYHICHKYVTLNL